MTMPTPTPGPTPPAPGAAAPDLGGRRRAGWRRAGPAMLAVALGTTGCGARALGLEPLDTVVAPTLVELPADASTSPQLDAVTLRDTAGLPSTEAPVRTELLAPALEALRAAAPAATELTRVSVYDRFVVLTFLDPAAQGRSVSASWDDDGVLRLGEPTFSDDETFPLAEVDPAAIAAAVDGIHRRFPLTAVSSVDLNRSLSYEFGLVWWIRLTDARGDLATLFADPADGSIVAVDLR